jgi:hypothetical protein
MQQLICIPWFYFIRERSTSPYQFKYFANIESKTASAAGFRHLVLPQLTVPPAGRNYFLTLKLITKMENMTQRLLADMQREFQEVEVSTEDTLKKAQLSFNIVEKHLRVLKDFITTRTFNSTEEEIRFFKEIKPEFLRELVYYAELYSIEELKPNGSNRKQRKYYEQCLVNIEIFFDRNRKLYNYYRTGQIDSDGHFFVRTTTDTPANPDYRLDLDPNFSTSYSNKLGMLQAYEHLREYLLGVISDLGRNKVPRPGKKKRRNITWTDHKTALIELLYAVHVKGSINHGNIPINYLMSAAEEFFNIRLGNVYTAVLGIGRRKKGRTPYLHSAITSFEDWLDEKDE